MTEAALLREGRLELRGRILPASNVTYLGEVSLDGCSRHCVYKPVAGERPLWDFPHGTLAAREVAAYLVSEALGWDVVPLTLLRDGPAGAGMVQLWCDIDDEQHPVDVVPEGALPPGYLHVLDAVDRHDSPVSLVHEDTDALRRMAVFDAVINNADRKGGHILPMADGHRYGVDHGVSFHVANKLRTVLWGWADQPLSEEDTGALRALRRRLEPGEPLADSLRQLLAEVELQALRRRCDRLLARGRMPLPARDWPAIPWPAF